MDLTKLFGPRFISFALAQCLLWVAASCSKACDTATICAWQRTWYGPNALAMPLRGYFIPRMPGRCDRDVYAGGFGCADNEVCSAPVVRYNAPGPGPGWMVSPEAGIGVEPVRFERLGQVPNDLDTSVGAAPPTAAR